MRLLTPVMYLVALLSLVAVGVIAWLGISFRQFDTIEAGGTIESCVPVVGVAGAADIEPKGNTSIAFLSTFDRRGNADRGAILSFDTENPLDETSWIDRTSGQPVLFEPMGIDHFFARLPDGRELSRLFVVNLAGPEVLIYDVAPDGDLSLLERVSDARLNSPNDVVATGPRSFYVTNDTSAGRETLRGKVDFLFGLKTGTILRYDGERWDVPVDGLAFPNGLALADRGQTLFLAEMRAKSLTRFRRDPQSDSLTLEGSVPLGSFPDNLSVDEDGNVLVGTVPQPLSFTAYGEGLKDMAASSVIRVTPSGLVETLFQDPGERLSAATVGVRMQDKILIGSRAADRFLMCEDD